MRDHEITARIDAAVRDATHLAPRLANTMRRVDEWTGGYPAGGSSGSRGGDTTPLPERLAVAGVIDVHANDLLEAEVTLRLVSDGLTWLRAFDARSQPLTLAQCRPQPTATCLDCGRTIAATAVDPVKAGRCTSSKDEAEVGCYGRWERERKARQRGRDMAEDVEAVPCGE